MTRILTLFLSLVLLQLFGAGCSSTRLVKPLAEKELAVGFDFGGPIIDFSGLKIPIPFTSFTGAYGLDSTLTLFGSLHTTALASSVLQLETGVLKDIVRAKNGKPGFSLAGTGHWMMGLKDARFRFYPSLDLNLYWPYSRKHEHFAYMALNSWFDFWAEQAHGQPNKNHYLPSLSLGHTFVTKSMRYTLEARWLAPHLDNRNIVVGYNGIAHQGSLGFYFSIYKRF
jgi:hypothetical protein